MEQDNSVIGDDHAPPLSSPLSIAEVQARERRRVCVFAYMERETMKTRLESVTVASRAAMERLETAPGQEGFVESVTECLAGVDRRRCWRPVGVYDGDALTGFVMYGSFREYLPFGRLWLDRLLIDRHFQSRGYGQAAPAALLEWLEREYHEKRIYLSVVKANRPAVALYESFDFRFIDERDTHGERVMCLCTY